MAAKTQPARNSAALDSGRLRGRNKSGRISTACESCKRKKARCSGGPPPCQNCRISGTHCIIDVNRDKRRKASTHRLEDEVQQYKQLLNATLQAVATTSPAVHQSVLDRLRSDTEISDCLDCLDLADLDDDVFSGSEATSKGSKRKRGGTVALEGPSPGCREGSDMGLQNSLKEANERSTQYEQFLNILLTAPLEEVEEILGQLRYLSNDPKFFSCPQMDVSGNPIPSAINSTAVHQPLLAEAVQQFLRDRDTLAQMKNQQSHRTPNQALTLPTPPSVSPPVDPTLYTTSNSNLDRQQQLQQTRSLFRYDTETSNPPEEGALWSQLTVWVCAATVLPALFGSFARDLDDHVTIIGITRGWDVIRSQVILDPQWEVIAQWETEALSQGRQVDRLALVRLLRRGLKFYAALDPTAVEVRTSIPGFLQPIEAQALLERGNIINLLPWPGVRLRMIEDQQKQKWTFGNEFWKRYLTGYRFDWNDDSSSAEAFTFNNSNSMMMFTKEFDTRWNDLNCWMLKQDFLNWFPDLKGEARAF